MALGFTPLSSSAISDCPAPPKGIVTLTVDGVSATGQIGTANGGALILYFATGVEATAEMGVLSDILTDNSNRTVFQIGFKLTSVLGNVSPSARTGSIVQLGVLGNTQLGTVIAQGTFVPVDGVAAAVSLGLTTQQEEQPWMQIIPSSSPGWVDIVIHAPVE